MIAAYDADWCSGGRPSERLDLPGRAGVLASWVPRDAVDDAVEVTGKGARRKGGKLPPHVMVYFAMAQYVTAVAFSSDGKTLATGNFDGTTYLWNLASGTHTVISEPGTVWAVAFSKDGMLAIGDDDGSTYLWDVATGGKTATLTDPASGSQCVGAVAIASAPAWPST